MTTPDSPPNRPKPFAWFSSGFHRSADALLAVVFPTSCPLCGQELADARVIGICGRCWQSLEPWTGPACSGCGLPFVSDTTSESGLNLCGPCRREEYAFDLARSYGLYAQNLRATILQLKFHRRERWGGKLGELLAQVWEPVEARLAGQIPLLVPVPLHPSRQRERGFNQAELLARGLRRQLERDREGAVCRLETRCLRRVQPTLPQVTLGENARWENVRRVFSADPGRVRGRAVALVDDVMTTGATASACAQALKRAGAQAVMVVTLARATPQFPDGLTAHPG